MSAIRSKVPLAPSTINPGDRYVCAVFDFSPSVSEELELEKGNVIKVLEKVDDFWIRGLMLHNGQSGQFPQDFVKEISIPRCSGNETLLYALDTFYPEAGEDLPFEKGEIIVLEKKINNEWGTGRCGPSKGMFPLNYTERLLPLTISSCNNQMKEKLPSSIKPAVGAKVSEGLGTAKATMSLTAQLEEELSFCVGDEITITEVLEDGTWYKGRLGSEVGTFPASFVTLLTPLKTDERPHPAVKAPLNRTGSKAWKEGSGEITTNSTNNNNILPPATVDPNDTPYEEKNILKTSSEYRCAEDVLPISTNGAHTENDSKLDQSSDKVIYTVKSLYKFTGNTERELSFEKDLRIPIMEEVDEHWLVGKVGGLEGYIPRAYVTVGNKDTSNNVSCVESKNSSKNDPAQSNNDQLHQEKSTPSHNNKNYVKITSSKLLQRHHVYTAPNNSSNMSKPNNAVLKKDTNLKRARAIYDYQAANKFDLSIMPGETLWISREVDENWCEVKNTEGRIGIVPTSYIERTDKDKDAPGSAAQTREYPTDQQQSSVLSDVKNKTENRYNTQSQNEEKQPGFLAKSSSYSNAHAEMSSTTMPVLYEQSDHGSSQSNQSGTKLHRQHAFSSPKPFGGERSYRSVQSSFTRKQGGLNPERGVLIKSMSVDSGRREQSPTSTPIQSSALSDSHNPHRSASYGSANDSRAHLAAWRMNRLKSNGDTNRPHCVSPDESAVPPTAESDHVYETPIPASSRFTRTTPRSASMREKKTQRRCEDNPAFVDDSKFVKIKSDSDLSAKSGKNRIRPRSSKSLRGDRPAARKDILMRTGDRDSVSTTSTESGSSFGDTKGSYSTQSDASTCDSAPSVLNYPTIAPTVGSEYSPRPAPPVPPRANIMTSSPVSAPPDTSLDVNYPPSPWSPPVPKRKQSLHRSSKVTRNKEGDHALSPSRAPGTQSPSRRTYSPVRPAPKLPPNRPSNKGGNQGLIESDPARSLPQDKKVPPMRPANPPMASPIGVNCSEKKKPASSRETKEKIEKLRTDIEEYTRMKNDLEALYQGTMDGRERREISENKEFVKANLRRLQKEFHDLIADQQDHIYESIEPHIRPLPRVEDGNNNMHTSLPAPHLPQPPDSPASIRRRRDEKRLLVVKEIVHTERDFVTDVTVTVDDIMRELVDREVAPQMISVLFGNIEQIKEFAEGLLEELEEALENESSVEPNHEALTIGQVFIDNIPNMKDAYMTYCRNHDDSITTLEKCEGDPEFVKVVGECLEAVKKSKVNVFDLGSFLIKPVQRILKYPLLINELIKLTDPCTASEPTDLDKLVLAAKMMQGVANDINEDKRTKDLVRKYKNASSEGLTEKLGKISIKSLKKKSTRISRRIGHVTGITAQGTRDAQFDVLEKRYKTLERALKMFIGNVTTYCDKFRDVLFAELHVSKAIVEMVYMPDRTHPVSQYQAVAEKMSGPLYRQFHDQVQLRALSPISALLVSFKGPQTIIDKRYDKLLDYEQLQKNSDSKEKIQAAKYDYEALNKSLLDELPKLCDLGLKLLTSCTAIFAQVHKEFEVKLLNALNPILVTIQQAGDGSSKIPSNHEIEDRFKPCHAEAVHDISRLQVVPGNFGALVGSNRGSAEPGKKQRTISGTKQSHESPKQQKQARQQSIQSRQALLQKFPKEQLFVAKQSYVSSQLMEISCAEGDVIAVLKQQDPMGSRNRWFIDNGASTGFLPATLLQPYEQSSDETFIKVPLGNSGYSPTTSVKAPIPAPRSKSPTPSSRSTSSADSSGSAKPPLSAFTLRERISKGTLPPEESLPEEDLLEAFAEEDEIFNDEEYEPLPASSPKSTKQHFRAQFDFTARSDLELTVRTGDIVKLIMAHDTDGNSEWWLVSNADGKQGYVPFNYLCKAEYL